MKDSCVKMAEDIACDVMDSYAGSVKEGFGDCKKSYTKKDAEGSVVFYKEQYFG